MKRKPFDLTINISGHLMDLEIPKVMGILNVTPDSFYEKGRTPSDETIREKIAEYLAEEVDIIDIGGCSTRPGFVLPSESEELERVNLGCRLLREMAPNIPLSVDTFRAAVAKEAVKKWNAAIINDISGGEDREMWSLVADKKVAYVLTHNTPVSENADITAEAIIGLSKKLNELHRIGVNDVIIDPGFGFAKSLDDNFRLLDELNEFCAFGCPVMVGISRKSMIYKTLGVGPEESLTGTIALDSISLEKGADILRVHDVHEAKETVKLFTRLKNISL